MPAPASSSYDPTIIAIEIIQSLQNQSAPASQSQEPSAIGTQNNASPQEAAQQVGQSAAPGAVNPPAQNTALESTVSTAVTEIATVETQMGPFGWVGIGFLLCIIFACLTNFYLKSQKKAMDTDPTREELSKFAPEAMLGK